jgi:hypothetical protein
VFMGIEPLPPLPCRDLDYVFVGSFFSIFYTVDDVIYFDYKGSCFDAICLVGVL